MEIPKSKIISLYLLLLAARNGCNRVKLKHEFLKTHLGRKRIHYGPLRDFVESLAPVFKLSEKGTDHYGVKTNITISAASKPEVEIKSALPVKEIPSVEIMCKELGLRL